MRRYGRTNIIFECGSFEITKRELLASISIIAVLFLIGMMLSGRISDYQLDQNERYDKAVKIETQDLFEYGMRTNIGNAFVCGELAAVDTVTYPEIKGSYMYLEKVKERYTMHTRQVAHTRTVNGHTQTYYTTETYWSWDRVGSERQICNEISFLGVVFNTGKIDIPDPKYVDTVKESSHIRYKYYGVGTQFTGTIFTELRDDTITDGTAFYENRTIDETLDLLETGYLVNVFWIFWAVFMCICIFAFYYIDNRWLE